MYAAGEDVYLWLIDGMTAVLEAQGIWPGKLIFYRAVHELAEIESGEMERVSL